MVTKKRKQIKIIDLKLKNCNSEEEREELLRQKKWISNFIEDDINHHYSKIKKRKQ